MTKQRGERRRYSHTGCEGHACHNITRDIPKITFEQEYVLAWIAVQLELEI